MKRSSSTKRNRKVLLLFVTVVAIAGACLLAFLRQEAFGSVPFGKDLTRLRASPHYVDGSFRNLVPTPMYAEGVSPVTALIDFFFRKKERLVPTGTVPTVRSDLKKLARVGDKLVWFGHSSLFLQLDGFRVLVDPTFSGSASPVPGTIKAFSGTNTYAVSDLPDIDLVLITHDHWDHLDYRSMKLLLPKTARVICGLGVGPTLVEWGYTPSKIIELDWEESRSLGQGLVVTAHPARHFSGRDLRGNRTLWVSYSIRTPALNIFISGDSGYSEHFSTIGAKYGPFDLAILENGQYDPKWKYIHLLPKDLVRAFHDVRAKRLLTVHNSKFPLANHPWNEPLELAFANCGKEGVPLLTPMIGEVVELDDSRQTFIPWWRDVP